MQRVIYYKSVGVVVGTQQIRWRTGTVKIMTNDKIGIILAESPDVSNDVTGVRPEPGL